MFSQNLRRIMKQRNIKNIEICRALELSPSRFSNYLNNHREPDLATLKQILDYLHITFEQVMSDTPELSDRERAAILSSMPDCKKYLEISAGGQTVKLEIHDDTIDEN